MDLSLLKNYLIVIQWGRFLSFVFAFLFFGILTFYFTNEQVQYKRKDWKVYSTSFFNTEFQLLPDRDYTISWNDNEYSLTGVDINEFPNHFLNFYHVTGRWRTIYGNWYEEYISGPIHVRVRDTTFISFDLRRRDGSEENNPFTHMNRFVVVNIKEDAKEGNYFDIQRLLNNRYVNYKD